MGVSGNGASHNQLACAGDRSPLPPQEPDGRAAVPKTAHSGFDSRLGHSLAFPDTGKGSAVGAVTTASGRAQVATGY